MAEPRTSFGTAQRAQAMRLSLVEGVLFAWMVGLGETYFPANAIQLGASAFQVGLVYTVPLAVGGLGPVVVMRLLARLRARRVVVTAMALLQSFVLLGLAAANVGQWLTVDALIVACCLYQVCGQASGAAWGSWYGDVVPRRVRGAYFSQRNRLVHLCTFLGLLTGGLLLYLLEPMQAAEVAANGEGAPLGGAGFALVFLLAGVFRLFSATLLWRSPEPEFTAPPKRGELTAHLRSENGRNARRLLIGSALYQVAVYTTGPYYAPFMLEALRFDYLTFTLATGTQVVAKVVAMPRWGRAVDRLGARHAYGLGLLLTAIVPLPWVFAEGLPAILAAQVLSGIAWGGYEVALFALMLDSSTSSTRAQMFGAQSMGNGFGQIAGGMVGSALLAGHGYAGLFAVGFAARFAVALVVPATLRDMRPVGAPRREPLLLRIIGFRPGPGLNHRPIPEPSSQPVDLVEASPDK